jgi:phage protein D
MTTTSAYVSTPVLTVAGQTNATLATDLLSLAVEENIVGMIWCEARFNNFGYRNNTPGYLYLGRDTLDFGTDLGVTFGAGDQTRQVFTGKVSAIQADYPAADAAQVLIFAEDSLQAFRMTRRTRSFETSSTADIAQQLASEHSLTPSVNLTGPTRDVVTQVNQSDLAFLRSLARTDDGEVWLDGTTLHLEARPDRATDSGDTIDLYYGGGLVSLSVRADLADQCTELGVAGWDVANKDAISETSDASDLGSELGSDTSGASILSTALGQRKERIVRAAPLSTADATALAKAAYLERARRFVCGTGMTTGTAPMRVGSQVNLTGLGGIFEGVYYVSRTRHMFDVAEGYRTEFDVERAGIGAAT